MLSISVVVTWEVSCPNFNFSNTCQLVLHTWTTIITFLMVFLIQNSQNRDSKALQKKRREAWNVVFMFSYSIQQAGYVKVGR